MIPNWFYVLLGYQRRLGSLLVIGMLILTGVKLGVLMTAIETSEMTCWSSSGRCAHTDRHRNRITDVAH